MKSIIVKPPHFRLPVLDRESNTLIHAYVIPQTHARPCVYACLATERLPNLLGPLPIFLASAKAVPLLAPNNCSHKKVYEHWQAFRQVTLEDTNVPDEPLAQIANEENDKEGYARWLQ